MSLMQIIYDAFNITDKDPYSNMKYSYCLTASTKFNENDKFQSFPLKHSSFPQRHDAEQEMYKIASKLGLGRLVKLEDDTHCKTYISEENKWFKFQINRTGLGE